jgi:hypothetical protein
VSHYTYRAAPPKPDTASAGNGFHVRAAHDLSNNPRINLDHAQAALGPDLHCDLRSC